MGRFTVCSGNSTCRVLIGLICVLGLVQVTGCSGAASAGAEATGTITLDGAPLPNAFISFIPKGGGSSAYATSDAEGKFSVSSSGSLTGLAAGEYGVIVEPGDAPDGGSAGSEGGDDGGEGGSEASGGNSNIPKKYMNQETSGLTVSISEGEQKAVTLELSSTE